MGPHYPLLPPRLKRAVALVGAAALVSGLTVAAVPAGAGPKTVTQAARAATDEPGVTANLWEWNWKSIRKECPTLAESGYSGVQVAPPQNSVKRTDLGNGSDTILHPWWEVYQPVTYDLTSRMGNETQFKKMVKACRRVGVKVYVDAVINHMTGQGHTSY